MQGIFAYHHCPTSSPDSRTVILKFALFSLLAIVVVAALLVTAGQLGFLRGSPPQALGVHEGRLAAPSNTPNSISSQAALYPGHPQAAYAMVEPFAPRSGESGAEALQRLAGLLLQQPGTELVSQTDGYVRTEATTPWLRFVDDVELWLDPVTQLVHVRSSSRIGRKDFGVNRARVSALRTAFTAEAPPL